MMALSAQPEDRAPSPGTKWCEQRKDTHKLSSDLHIFQGTCVPIVKINTCGGKKRI